MTLNVFRFLMLFSSLTFIPLGYFVYLKDARSSLNRAFLDRKSVV